MSEDKKTIQEALAEVQRNAELKRIEEAKKAWGDSLQVDEASMPNIKVGGKKVQTSTKPTTAPAANQNTPSSTPAPTPTSGLNTATNIATGASMLPKKMLGGAAVGAAAGELGKEIAFGSEKARQLGHDIYKNVPGAAAVSDTMLKAREYLGLPSTAPKEYQRTSADLPKIDVPATPKAETPKPEAPKPAPKAETPSSFGAAFKAAREKATAAGKPSTGQFEFQGKKYQTNIKGEKYVPMTKQTKVDSGSTASTAKPAATPSSSVPLPPKRPDDLGKVNAPMPPSRPSDLPKPSASGLSSATKGFDSGKFNPNPSKNVSHIDSVSNAKYVGDNLSAKSPQSFKDIRLSPEYTSGNAEFPMSAEFKRSKPETESGGKKKKMSEDTNPLIAAFLDLQAKNPSNMFEAAKKAKKDYDKDGKVESPKDEVWGSRFRAAKAAGKMEEEQIDELKKPTPETAKKVVDRSEASDEWSAKAHNRLYSAYKKRYEPKAGKMEEGVKADPNDPSYQGGGDVTSTPEKKTSMPKPTAPKTDSSVQGSGDVTMNGKPARVKEETEIEEGTVTGPRSYKGSPDRKRKAVQMALGRKHKDHPDWNPRTNPQYSALKLGRKLQKQGVTEEEEVTFSQEEIDHINSFFLEASVAPNRPEVAIGADSTSDKMSPNDVTGTAESGKKIRKEETQIDEHKSMDGDPLKVGDSVGFKDGHEQYGKIHSISPQGHAKVKVWDSEAGEHYHVTKHVSRLWKETNEEVELDEISKNLAKSYTDKSKTNISDLNKATPYLNKMYLNAKTSKDKKHYEKTFNKNMETIDRRKKGIEMAGKVLSKEEVELEEGRPRKNPTPETTERDPRQHIQVAAGRAAAGNVIDFHHNNGTKSKITPAMGRRITSHLNGLKPADRQAAVNKMHDSAEGLKV